MSRLSGSMTGARNGELNACRRKLTGREGRFLTSNVNITVEEDGEVISTPIGSRFAKFQTPM